MSNLISRQAAIDAICRDGVRLERGGALIITISTAKQWAVDLLEELPSAQPEIIYCKDCLYWMPGYITDQDDFIPSKCGKYQQMVGHSGDDYCSYAERKDDE